MGDIGAAGAQAATSAIGGVKNIVDDTTSRNDAVQARDKLALQTEDLNNRREATYRQDRGILMSALGSYYKQQGWAMPDSGLPGEGTSKQLPFEPDLYNGPSQNQPYASPEQANIQPGKPVYADPNSATGVAQSGPAAAGPNANDAVANQSTADTQTSGQSGASSKPTAQDIAAQTIAKYLKNPKLAYQSGDR